MKSKEKKSASLWYLVAVNYLSTFFGAAFLVVIPTFVLAYFGVIDERFFASALGQIGVTLINLIVLAFTAWQTAVHLKTTYVLEDTKKIVRLTAFVAIAASIFGIIFGLLLELFLQDIQAPTLREYAMYIGTEILSICVFYFVNKRFLTKKD